ncbi:androgen-dependent TFPI-regulating protein isoform X4 [Phascolarctos cinereus]
MARASVCIYHFLVWGWYIFINCYLSFQAREQQLSQMFPYGGQWKYLTMLNLLLQAIFYGVACLDDLLKRMRRNKDIKWVTASRDLLFTTLAFPASAFVFMSFWTIFLYDRELIYPKSLDRIFPKWWNHAMVFNTSIAALDLLALKNESKMPITEPEESISASLSSIRARFSSLGTLLCYLFPKWRPFSIRIGIHPRKKGSLY